MAGLDPTIETMLFQPDFGGRNRGRAARALLKLGSAALDFLYPPHCVSCGKTLPGRIGSVVCAECAQAVRWIGADRCLRCGDSVGIGRGAVDECVSCREHPPRFVKAVSCSARYEAGPVRDIVLGLKFGGRAFAGKMTGRIMARRILQTGLLDSAAAPLLVPAPLTRRALFHRGYNQAAELARWVGRELNLKIETKLLKKIKSTRPQATLTEKQRRINVQGAFACSERLAKKYRGANVLLIDDVITTGSTISECARVLHDAGLGRIVAASFARG